MDISNSRVEFCEVVEGESCHCRSVMYDDGYVEKDTSFCLARDPRLKGGMTKLLSPCLLARMLNMLRLSILF
jgi:hypothetical protein